MLPEALVNIKNIEVITTVINISENEGTFDQSLPYEVNDKKTPINNIC